MSSKIGLYAENVDGVWFGVACDDVKVFATTFGFNEETVLRNLLDCVPLDLKPQAFQAPSAFAKRILDSVKSAYDGKGETEKVSLATEGLTPFCRQVLEVIRLIPVGYVTSYGALSEAAGGSARAVGRALAANPFAPIIPCHRVARSDMTLGGYGGGLEVKAEMLVREKRGNITAAEISVLGKRFRIFPAEWALEKLRK